MTPPPPQTKKVDKSKKVWTHIDPALSLLALAQMALGSISQKNLHNNFCKLGPGSFPNSARYW